MSKSRIGNWQSKILVGGTMANVPEDLHYSKDHEWVRVEGDVSVVGITDYAQDSLGDVVYVELPKAGEEFAANESFGSVESVKAVPKCSRPFQARWPKSMRPLTMSQKKLMEIPTAKAG
jgi:hypothetical protein